MFMNHDENNAQEGKANF